MNTIRTRLRHGPYLITRDGDRVVITRAMTGDVVSEHGMGTTTITGTSPALSADDRREIHAALRRAEISQTGVP